MEAARAAVSKITGRAGHNTDVDETVNPAVTSQTIKPHRHEETTEAVNREVHQDHYHTTIQPISHTERLPEKHAHNLAPQVEREFHHGDDNKVRQSVDTELGRFQDTSRTHQTTHSTAAAASVTGEHVHHHVHESVQPIIHKETIQPEVVHTTVPIHETHTRAATHHNMSALPTKSLQEFEQAGGSLTGGQRQTHEEYEGCPRPYNESLTTNMEKVLPGSHHHHHQQHSSNVAGGNVVGTGTTRDTYGSNTHSGLGNTTGDRYDNTTRDTYGSNKHSGLGNTTGDRYDNTTRDTLGSTGHSGLGGNSARDTDVGSTTGNKYDTSSTSAGTTGAKKPSLMDKLNPYKDSDGDGKPGFMK